MTIKRTLRQVSTAVLAVAWFVIAVPTQFVLVVLLCLLLPESLAAGLLAISSPFWLGVLNYFFYTHLTQRRAVLQEAKRWLAERSGQTQQQRAKLIRRKQIGIWIPVILVMTTFLFLPEFFAVVTHVFRRGPAKLIGYEISFPATWIVTDVDMDNAQTWAVASGIDCRGPLRSGLRRYWFLNLRASAVGVVTWSSEDDARRHNALRRNTNTPLSTRSVLLGGDPAICREYPHDYTDWAPTRNLRRIECSTSDERLFVSFDGDKADLPGFYRNLGRIRKLR